jgi:hypothetical protein
MATKTYEPIATTTLASAAASYTFSSIPGTYTDIILIASLLGTSPNYPRVKINADAGAVYSYTYMTGNGTAADSNRSANVSGSSYVTANAQFSATSPLILQSHFQSYSNTTTNKTFLNRVSQAGTAVEASISLWRSSNAITSIEVLASGGNLAIGSVLTLYGIKAA